MKVDGIWRIIRASMVSFVEGRRTFPIIQWRLTNPLNFTWKINALKRASEMCENILSSGFALLEDEQHGSMKMFFRLSRSPFSFLALPPSLHLANATWKIYNRRRKKKDKTTLNSKANTYTHWIQCFTILLAPFHSPRSREERKTRLSRFLFSFARRWKIRCLHYCRLQRCRSSLPQIEEDEDRRARESPRDCGFFSMTPTICFKLTLSVFLWAQEKWKTWGKFRSRWKFWDAADHLLVIWDENFSFNAADSWNFAQKLK